MPDDVDWGEMTDTDFEAIGDRSIQKRLLELGASELRFPPHKCIRDEGWVRGHEGQIAWRRGVSNREAAIRRGDPSGEEEKEAGDRKAKACDYYLIYREATSEERRRAEKEGRSVTKRVVRILGKADLEKSLSR